MQLLLSSGIVRCCRYLYRIFKNVVIDIRYKTRVPQAIFFSNFDSKVPYLALKKQRKTLQIDTTLRPPRWQFAFYTERAWKMLTFWKAKPSTCAWCATDLTAAKFQCSCGPFVETWQGNYSLIGPGPWEKKARWCFGDVKELKLGKHGTSWSFDIHFLWNGGTRAASELKAKKFFRNSGAFGRCTQSIFRSQIRMEIPKCVLWRLIPWKQVFGMPMSKRDEDAI